MASKARKEPEIVARDGRPAAVILDIEVYREMLERLEDAEDLQLLGRMRQRPLRFRGLHDAVSRSVTSRHQQEGRA